MTRNRRGASERGQAFLLLAMAMIGLLGFSALAIDGGMILTERRTAQNAADNAAFAAARTGMSGGNWQAAGLAFASTGGYDNNGTTNWVTVSQPANDEYQVTVVSRIQTSFAHLIYSGPLESTVTAVVYGRAGAPPMAGYAIVAMGNCLTEGGHLISVTGGGNSGGVQAFDGGIFVNTPENSGNRCALDPPNNGYGITADTLISSVGSHNYASASMMSPIPIDAGYNNGSPIDDPLASLPEPTCSGNGSVVGNNYSPGKFGGSGQPAIGPGTYAPGIYCITGDVHLSGQAAIVGDGVVLYLINGGLLFTGQAGLRITAPTEDNCGGSPGNTNDSCTYVGVAIFASRSNTDSIEVRGNGGNAIEGLVYALNGTVQARGGGADPDETNVEGQVIAKRVEGNGNGSFKVIYNGDMIYNLPPMLELLQ